LIGIVLPTAHPQAMSQYAQFQFKYYGKGIKDFYIQIIGKSGTIDVNQNAEGEDCWKLFTYDWSSSDSLIQFNVFVNKQGNPGAITCLFDDFKLAGIPAIWVTGTTLSEASIKLKKGDVFQLTADAQGNPFSWVSSDLAVAKVDQLGNVTATGGGITTIMAVPLYGDPVECIVTVEGTITPTYKEEVFLDFETIVLDWASGYGAFAWNSDKQSIAGNPAVNDQNPSSKSFQWTREASSNKWGGYGIVLPIKKTDGWERISFQVYADKPVTTIRLELFQTDVSQGNFTISNLAIPANKWTTVSVNLTDLGMINKTFDKVQMQIAGGSDVALMTTYSDNFKFEKGPPTSVRDLASNSEELRIYPNPASDILNVIAPNQSYHLAQIINLSGQTLIQQKITAGMCQIDIEQLSGEMYLLVVKGENGNLTKRFIVNKQN
jgi:hypothetical protein